MAKGIATENRKLMCESCTVIEKQLDKYKNRTEGETNQVERVELRAEEEIKG